MLLDTGKAPRDGKAWMTPIKLILFTSVLLENQKAQLVNNISRLKAQKTPSFEV